MTKHKSDTEPGERPYYMWEILHGGQVFRMIASHDPAEVAAVWLNSLEDGGPLPLLPTHINVDNITVPIIHPHPGVVLATWAVCRLRDLQRKCQGLPPYWAELADRQETILAGGRPEAAWGGNDRDLMAEDPIDPPWGLPPWKEEEP